MKQGNTQSRQPSFCANKQYPRLRARPLEVGRGCRRKQLPFFHGTTILGTTVARWADLLRWADPQDMSRQVGLVDGACNGSFQGTYLVIVYSSTQDAVRQEQTILALRKTTGVHLRRVVLHRVGSTDTNCWHHSALLRYGNIASRQYSASWKKLWNQLRHALFRSETSSFNLACGAARSSRERLSARRALVAQLQFFRAL